MAARILMVVLVLVVLAVVGVAVWLAMQPATSPSSAPVALTPAQALQLRPTPLTSSTTLSTAPLSPAGLAGVIDDARSAAGGLGLYA